MREGTFKPHEAAAFLTLFCKFDKELTVLADCEALF